ncbi:signal peptidase I [Streptomyces sp. NPDC007818]|uniref:signal peptidase I n=1 Tax=Streptomyces sp. NPDC007818 TaxID=3364780 RepID=UPI0036B417A3
MSGTTKKRDGHGRLDSVLSGLAVAVGCLLFLGGFAAGALLYRPYTVPTGSMAPTFEPGSKLLAQRIDGDEVRRGDVVVFEDPLWGGSTMVKRVVAVGGDTVACCGTDGHLTVNGTPVEEPYLRPGPDGTVRASAQDFTATVPEDSLFLLGDDRASSLDSRTHLEDAAQGSVPRSTVVARVDAVAWPLSGGSIERPAAFAALPGGISTPGPLTPLLTAIAAGAALILAGAAHGPLSRRLGARNTPAGEKVKA